MGDGLEAVVAAHMSWTDAADGCMGCDWKPDNADYAGVKHRAHVADQIRAHLAAALGETREDVARAFRTTVVGIPRPWSEVSPRLQAVLLADADAALTVIAGALGLDTPNPTPPAGHDVDPYHLAGNA